MTPLSNTELREAIDKILTDNFMGDFTDRSDIPLAIDQLLTLITTQKKAWEHITAIKHAAEMSILDQEIMSLKAELKRQHNE